MAVKAARRGGDEAVDGLLTILGGGDERAALFEHIGRDLTVEGIVLGHEDTDAVEARARFRLWRGRPVRCVDRQRKCDGEGRALALRAEHAHAAAVRLGHVAHDGQFDGLLRDSEAEAAAGIGRARGLVSLSEGVERTGLKFPAHARSRPRLLRACSCRAHC